MKQQQIIGIRRDSLFSPNHIGNDRIIFDKVITELAAYGYNIPVYSESEFMAMEGRLSLQAIVTMGRDKKLVATLQSYEQDGVPVFNSAFGIQNCYRVNMVKGLIAAGIPHPKSFIVSTEDDVTPFYRKLSGIGVWVKRGDFHALHREDVSFAASEDECRHIINEYAMRGIETAVLCEHLLGDLVKFYGVRGTDFFHWFYPYDARHHKFSEYEAINGQSRHYPFDAAELHAAAERSAACLGVHIYGGDAIVDAEGRFQIIDLNDWPSFAPCWEAGAKAISTFLAAALDPLNKNDLNVWKTH